jgi:hypothetical protein
MVNYVTFDEARHLREIVRLCLDEGWTSYADSTTALRGLTAPGSVVVVGDR